MFVGASCVFALRGEQNYELNATWAIVGLESRGVVMQEKVQAEHFSIAEGESCAKPAVGVMAAYSHWLAAIARSGGNGRVLS